MEKQYLAQRHTIEKTVDELSGIRSPVFILNPNIQGYALAVQDDDRYTGIDERCRPEHLLLHRIGFKEIIRLSDVVYFVLNGAKGIQIDRENLNVDVRPGETTQEKAIISFINSATGKVVERVRFCSGSRITENQTFFRGREGNLFFSRAFKYFN
ncbi:MAG: hypothetical protein NZO16_04570 [Deltaproteobacteria bacterium]|nr:hypothetical protein [Deltaproteobacteria bacterium]